MNIYYFFGHPENIFGNLLREEVRKRKYMFLRSRGYVRVWMICHVSWKCDGEMSSHKVAADRFNFKQRKVILSKRRETYWQEFCWCSEHFPTTDLLTVFKNKEKIIRDASFFASGTKALRYITTSGGYITLLLHIWNKLVSGFPFAWIWNLQKIFYASTNTWKKLDIVLTWVF